MKLNRKQKLFIFLLIVFAVTGVKFFLSYSNAQRNINVILITIDALRPDHLGCYGYNRNTSPNIDKLAKEGVLFTQAISQASWTNALVSLLTSTYPSTHRIEKFGTALDKRLITIAEILKKNNYATACSSDRDWIVENFPDLRRRFDYFLDISETNGLIKIEEIISWIRKFAKKDFFIWIHFFDYPHAPYLPSPPYNEMFISYERQKNIPIGKGIGIKGFIPAFLVVNNITDVNYYISQYDGEIAYCDEQIGRILDELKNLNLDKNTFIIISADHGESLGEHDYYFQHGFYLYDQLLKVPFIIKGPTIPKAKVINQQVQLIDIMPTILSILKIKVDIKMEGIDLLPIIFGRNDNQYFAFSEVMDDEGMNLKSIRTREWKLIHNLSTNKYELYNLRTDPGETINLAKIEKEQFEFLKTKLEEWMNRPRPKITPLTKSLDEETKERLKSLGYLQ